MRHGMHVLIAGGALAVACLVVPPASAQSGSVAAIFVVMGGSGPVARAVLTGATQCPSIALGSATQPMSVRPVPAAAAAFFPVLVCETLIPAGTTSASIAGQQLPLPGQTVNTVAGIGDTGCRLKNGKDKAGAAAGAERSHTDHDDDSGKFQDCDKPKQWPFAQLAQSVAQAKPDLVVHVGDYIYREAAWRGVSGCRASLRSAPGPFAIA